ncbi:MAG: DUF4856 domain-containing protein [Proteobacteria bacterium]|nr:DUF4856 domain-containing protein [Pseudomonadota bacterium]
MNSYKTVLFTTIAAALALPACGDSQDPVDVPESYAFSSRFASDASSVSYSGQVFRQVLIAELVGYMDQITDQITAGTLTPDAGDITGALKVYYDFDDAASGTRALTLSADPSLLQSSYDDISSGKNLRDKIAGNDEVGQHRDWAAEFTGWSEGGAASPDALIQYWFGLLDGLAVDRAAGTIPNDPDGEAITLVYITAKGQDLKQLIQKFLLGAVNLSQGLDDYLDNDTDGKGLRSSNLRDGDKSYSTLEHQWDEGFGYFGAARDYNDYTDDEIAGKGGREGYKKGYHDSNGDNAIDLLSEYNFGHSTNAAKRDRGSSAQAPTDFTKTIFDAFLTGRAIISSADGELDDDQIADLVEQRDIIAREWEAVVAATVVHYINETLVDMGTFGGSYNFVDHAKHWSELKGFALGLQFSRFSPLTEAQFAQLHQLIGDAPVLPNAPSADIEAYRQDLLMARDIVGQGYDFDPANLGDQNGENGW